MKTLAMIVYILICAGLGGMVGKILAEKQEAKWKSKARNIQSALNWEHHKRDYINALLNANYTTKKGVEEYNRYVR